MHSVRIFTANAGALGGLLETVLAALAPDIIALTGVGPARALRLAGPRSMRAATHGWSEDENSGLALLWKASLAVGELERFNFGKLQEPSGALRISLLLDNRHAAVYCAQLACEPSVAAAQKMRLAAVVDSMRQPTLLACEGIVMRDEEPWSRCADAWTIAQRRVVSLAASADAGLATQRAFGIAVGSTSADIRSHAGPVWHCSEEFTVLESRSIGIAGSPDQPIRTATVGFRISAAEENVAIAL